MRAKILILCSGNSCRSQMAEGFLKSFDAGLEVHSAGTNPAPVVHTAAIRVMEEVGINLQGHYPKDVKRFLGEPFDYLITVCDNARESCPHFAGRVNSRIHIGFEDPAEAVGSQDEITRVFRKVRDEIKEKFFKFYKSIK